MEVSMRANLMTFLKNISHNSWTCSKNLCADEEECLDIVLVKYIKDEWESFPDTICPWVTTTPIPLTIYRPSKLLVHSLNFRVLKAKPI